MLPANRVIYLLLGSCLLSVLMLLTSCSSGSGGQSAPNEPNRNSTTEIHFQSIFEPLTIYIDSSIKPSTISSSNISLIHFHIDEPVSVTGVDYDPSINRVSIHSDQPLWYDEEYQLVLSELFDHDGQPIDDIRIPVFTGREPQLFSNLQSNTADNCLLYTSDAADDQGLV